MLCIILMNIFLLSLPDQGARLKGTSNLQSAADLIFMEKKPSGNGKKVKNNNSAGTSAESNSSSVNDAKPSVGEVYFE